jgi:long-chain acyl-CoA synthetase
MATTTQPTRIFDLLEVLSSRPGKQLMFSSVSNGQWLDYTVSDYLKYVDLTSYALIKYGISKGEPVLSITHNRAEFNFVDMGIMQTGAVHVPLYPAVDVHKLADILKETGARIAFISNRSVLRKIQQIPSCPLQLIVSFDQTEGAVSYQDFLQEATADPDALPLLRRAVQPGDPASITYLSGSNTPLRGAVLTHSAHISNLLNYCSSHHFDGCSQSISFLPLAHSFERSVNYSFQYLGIRVTYNEGIASLAAVLRQKKPDVMLAVPLVLERIIESVKQEMLKLEGLKGWLAQLALQLAAREKAGPRAKYVFLKSALYKVAFKGLRNFLGGNIRVMLCGGAALRPETLNILWAAGIKTYEGYGLTEAGPLVSYNLENNFKSQSVGKIMPGVEVRIASDQEVLVKSGGLMKGYFNRTDSPIDNDGWLHTGDLGILDEQGFLTLTGIKKEIFKLSSGLYTDPRPIEASFADPGCIKRIWVYGHNRTALTAVIIPDNRTLPSGGFNTSSTVGKNLSDKANEIKDRINQELAAYNSACPKYEQLTKHEIVDDEWTTANGLLNSDGSLNRQALYNKYQDRINGMNS